MTNIDNSILRKASIVGFLVGSDLVSRVLQLAGLILLGRVLVPAALGDYLWAVSAATLAMLLVSAGADVGGLSAVARQPTLADSVWRAFIKIRASIAAVVAAVAFLIAAAIGGTRGLALVSAVLSTAATALSTDFVLLGLGRHAAFAAQRVAAAALNLVLILVFASKSTAAAVPPIWRGFADAMSYAASWLFVVRRERPAESTAQVSAWHLAVESAPRLTAAILIQIYWSIDLAILGFVAPPETVADYGIATRLMQVLAQPAAFAIFVTAQTISRRSETLVRGSARELWGILAVFGLAVIGGVALFGFSVVQILFGPSYANAGVYLLALTVPLAGHYLIAATNATLAYSRRSKAYVLTHAVGALVALVTGLVLIPRLEVAGAIVTQTAGIFAVVVASVAVAISGRARGSSTDDTALSGSLLTILRRLLRPLIGRGLRRRFPILDNWYAGLASRLTGRPVIVRGRPMYLDEYDSLGFLTREYEPGTSEIVSRLTMPDAVAVDVGAHIGFYTLLLSQRVGGGGQVYAFEPETTNFQLLSRNVQLNHCTNVTLEDSAVSDAAGRASLYVNEHNRGDHRLAPLASGGRSVVVRTVALDNYFNGRRKPDIIKIDVQGAEWRVLAGMRNLLAAPAPIVVIEWTPELIRSSGGDPVALLEEFRSRGFALFEVREPSLDLVPIEDEWIAAARPPGFYANLLCLPSDRSNGMRLLT